MNATTARCAGLLRDAEGLLATSAPDGCDAADSLLQQLDEDLLDAWRRLEAAGDAAAPRRAQAELEGFLFYRRGLLKRLASGGARLGRGLLSSVFNGAWRSRMFVFATHACQLRCTYCHVSKNGARMSAEIADAGVGLLMRSLRPEVEFHFFGGEPMLAFDVVRRVALAAVSRADAAGKTARFWLTTNGLELTHEALRFVAEHAFTLEFSCDGAYAFQLSQRAAAARDDYYARLQNNLSRLRDAGVRYNVITVILPRNAARTFEQVRFLAELGHRRIQVNYAVGCVWDDEAEAEFLRQIRRAGRWCRERGIVLINSSTARREPVFLNGDLTLDCDGTLFRGPVLFNGEVVRETDGTPISEPSDRGSFRRMRKLFHLASVGEAVLPDYYGATQFDNYVSLTRAYRSRLHVRRIVLNNVELGLRCRSLLEG